MTDYRMRQNDAISESSVIAPRDERGLWDSDDGDEGDTYATDYFPLDDSVTTCTAKDSPYSCDGCQIEWSFSVAYSHVWAVPVLYFRVQYLNGMPLSRPEVLNILRCGADHDVVKSDDSTQGVSVEEDDGWNFVSYEEHPITGVPSFFLHPCQTSKRLHLLMATGTNSDDSVEKNKSAVVLLSWLSMILPFGMSIY